MGWESCDVLRFDSEPLLQGQKRVAKHKRAYNSLIIGPRVLGCKTNLQQNMGWESSDVVRFDLGPLLQGQTRVARFNYSLFSGILNFHVRKQTNF